MLLSPLANVSLEQCLLGIESIGKMSPWESVPLEHRCNTLETVSNPYFYVYRVLKMSESTFHKSS